MQDELVVDPRYPFEYNRTARDLSAMPDPAKNVATFAKVVLSSPRFAKLELDRREAWQPMLVWVWEQARPTSFDLSRLITDLYGDQIKRIAERIRRLALPPNPRDIPGLHVEDLLGILAEGIPLFYVPRARVVKRLVEASGQAARRVIIGTEFEAVMANCEQVLSHFHASEYAY